MFVLDIGDYRCQQNTRNRNAQEQKCVKQVLAEKLSQAKEKEGGKKKSKK